MSLKIDKADYTNVSANNYADSAAAGNVSNYPNQYTVVTQDTDSGSREGEYRWTNPNWTTYLGYYKTSAKATARIDTKALWTVGQGFKFKGNVVKRFLSSRKLGIGNDTFTSILYNLDRTGQVAGDCFAEIIRDKQGRLINLKPLNPATMTIVTDRTGRIKRYEQTTSITKKPTKFKAEEMFHIAFNRIADEIHGISEFEKIRVNLDMSNELERDMKVVFHRYVKPLLITEADSDDPTEIAALKNKLDTAMKKGENMIIPKGSVNVQRVSIPQFSTLDPLPWLRNLDKDITIGMGVPNVISGASSEEDTEASSKIVYLAFEQRIKFRQMLWEEKIKNQLGLEIELKFPASIQPDLLVDNKKDGSSQKPDKIDPSKQSQ